VPLEEVEALPSPGNIEAATAEALVLAQVGALIRNLPPVDMQVIVLWLEGETAAAIAEITGLSPGAVNVRVHRIKALLARHFNPDGNPESDV
jgi:RNA polymerase sigma-70 factor (ECF subfamily)